MWWLGLLVAAPLVVLDPGHGGEARGVSKRGLEEADLVLDIARRAQQRLEAAGVQVRLTRTADVDVKLNARIGLAHRLEADAFVSIHINASPARARRGTETYIASVFGPDENTATLVAREQGAGDLPSPELPAVDRIVADLRVEAARAASADLGASLQKRLASVDGIGPDRGLRQAPFAVLQGARLPAALVEVGYLTHPEQARALSDPQTRRRIGRALAGGLLEYLVDRGFR
jgi:N-acetylmuramoyl-L-alanine amidase